MAYKLWSPNEVLTASDVNAYLMRQTVVKCTSGTRPSSPDEGMVVYETDTKAFKVYNGSAWRRIGGFDQETYGQKQMADSTSIGSISATSPTAGSPVVGFTFKAPPSGGVNIILSGRITSGANGQEMRLQFELRTGTVVGSGSVIVAASSSRALIAGQAVNSGAPATAGGSFFHAETTLTPLADYNVRLMHSVTGASNGGVEYRALTVVPIL